MRANNNARRVEEAAAGDAKPLFDLHQKMLAKYEMTSQKELRALPKFRGDAEPEVRRLMELADEWKVNGPAMSTQEIRAALDAAAELAPVAAAAEQVALVAKNVMTANRSRAWGGSMVYYSVLGRLAKQDPRLRNAFRPIKQSMSKKVRQSKKQRAQTSSVRAKATRQLKKQLTTPRKRSNASNTAPTGTSEFAAPATIGASNGTHSNP
jgi:hypothetical protein